MFVGSKPNFNLVLTPIIRELKELEIGISIVQSDHTAQFMRFFLIHGVYDKPARAAITGCKLMTGYSGCCKCLQTGPRCVILKKSKLKNFFLFKI